MLFVLGIALQVFGNQEGLRIILFFLTPLIVGIVATGVKRGFLLGFGLSFIFAIIGTLALSPDQVNAMRDINVALAFIILALITSVIDGALGAVGGFIGGRVFKKPKKPDGQS